MLMSGGSLPVQTMNGRHLQTLKNCKTYTRSKWIPGLTKKDIKITLFDNVLEVSGSRKSTNSSSNKYYKYNERLNGSFKRRFNIKDLIKDDKITATSKDGLLEIILPKLEKDIPKEKSIKIN